MLAQRAKERSQFMSHLNLPGMVQGNNNGGGIRFDAENPYIMEIEENDISPRAPMSAKEIEQRRHTMQEDMNSQIVGMLQTMGLVKQAPELEWYESTVFNVVMGLIITANCALIWLETDDAMNPTPNPIYKILNIVFAVIYIVEIALRLWYEKWEFFKRNKKINWNNWFDFIIVVAVVIETFIIDLALSAIAPSLSEDLAGIGILRVFRLLRLVRVVRLFKMFRELTILVVSIANTMWSLFWAFLFMFLFTYVLACMLVPFIGWSTEWDNLKAQEVVREYTEGTPSVDYTIFDNREYFGSVGRAMFTLFQIMTFDHWMHNILRYLTGHPFAIAGIFCYVGLTSWGILNIVIGAVVSNTIEEARKRDDDAREAMLIQQSQLLLSLRDFFMACDFDGNGTLELDELEAAMASPVTVRVMREIDVPFKSTDQLFKFLDADRSGSITFEEFVTGIIKLKHPAEGKDLLKMQMALQRALFLNNEAFPDQCAGIARICRGLTQEITKASNAANTHIMTSGDVSIKSRREGNCNHNMKYEPPPVYKLNEALLLNGQETVQAKPRRGASFTITQNLMEDGAFERTRKLMMVMNKGRRATVFKNRNNSINQKIYNLTS